MSERGSELNEVDFGACDGGAGKWGHYGREKGASDVVTLWPAGGATGPDVKWQFV